MAVNEMTVFPAKAHVEQDGCNRMVYDEINGELLVVMWTEPHLASPHFPMRHVVFESWAFLKNNLVVTPPLKVANLLWCCRFVVNHNVWIIIHLRKFINSEKVLLHRAVEVRQAVHHAIPFSPEPLRKSPEFSFQIVLRIIPGEVKFSQSHVVNVFDIVIIEASDIQPLCEVENRSGFTVLSHQIALLPAGCDVRVKDPYLRLSVPEILHICNFL